MSVLSLSVAGMNQIHTTQTGDSWFIVLCHLIFCSLICLYGYATDGNSDKGALGNVTV